MNDDNQSQLSANDDIDDVLDEKHQIDDQEEPIIADPQLVGYQDDLGTGEQSDVVIDEQSRERGDLPSQFTGMSEEVAKKELDKLALDEHGRDSSRDDDRREHIQDMNENDKDH